MLADLVTNLEDVCIWNDAFTYYTRKKEQEKKAPKNEDDQQQQQQSHADILVQLATDNTELFFNDQYGTAFALVTIDTDRHREVIRLESDKFRRYLSKLFYDNQEGRVVNSEAIGNAIHVLQAQTEYDGQTIPLSLRVACKKEEGGNDSTIYYDLTNPK
jgi:hypothetical protein